MSERTSLSHLAARVSNGNIKGVIADTRDDGQMMLATIDLEDGRRFTDVELPQMAGYSYRPNDGAEVWVDFVGGSPSHPVIKSFSDRRVRPTGTLEKGEAVFFNDAGHTFHLKGDGMTIVTDAPVTIETSDAATIKAAILTIDNDVQINGDLNVDGDIGSTGTNPNNHSH